MNTKIINIFLFSSIMMMHLFGNSYDKISNNTYGYKGRSLPQIPIYFDYADSTIILPAQSPYRLTRNYDESFYSASKR